MEGEGTVGRGSRGRRSGPRVPPEGKRRGRGTGQGAQPRLWVGQDVLARWSDGLLYLGKVRKVNRWKQMCLVRFEDNSEFWELWKDIYPPALPGMEGVCCLCGDSTLTQTNLIVNCGKCNQGYHQECHAPPINTGTTASTRWICRPCVFAVATKKGGALKKGPYANAMRLMKRVLPYQLESLDWDPQHLSNQQQCYCYCGGPGEWNVKMLQCFRCQHWFHEACTQCLSKPLLYGDRFYLFLCCVCTAGPEYVIRLSLAWVDIAHLVLYHLTSCCRRKYFDFEQEILAFANENWDNLLVGELSGASKTERYDHLLETLNAHRDRFVSGKEIKKRKCIFGLQERVPPPPPSPASLREGQQLLPPPSPPHTPTRSSVEERRRRRVRGEGRGRLRSELLSLKTRRARRLLEKARSQEVVKDPSSANQTYQGSRGSASAEPNTSHTQRTPPKMMFASIQPSTNAVRSLESSSSSSFDYGDGANVLCLPQARGLLEGEGGTGGEGEGDTEGETEGETETEGGEEAGWGAQGETASPCDSSEEDLPLSYLCSSVNTYFGAVGRLGRGETVRILARRHTLDNKVQYLVEWGGSTIF